MVKLTNKQIRYIINQVIKHKKSTKTMARLYSVSQRRVQQLVKIFRDTGEYPVQNPNRRPKTYLTEEEKEIILKDEEMYLARLREIQTQHLRSVTIPGELGEIEQIYESLTRIYDRIEELDPEYVFMRRGKPLSLNRIQMMLSS